MLATTTITWALLISSFAPGQHMQAATTIQGFGSPDACEAARGIVLDQLPKDAQAPMALCVPVDGAKPLPNALQGLYDTIHGTEKND